MTHELVVSASNGSANLRELVADSFLPLVFQDTGPLFRMSVRVAAVGGLRLAEVDTTAVRVDRDRALAARTDSDCYKILFQIAGQSRVTQRNTTSTVAPGEWVIYDATQPYRIESAHASRFVAALTPPRSSTMWRWFVERAGVRVRQTVGNARLALQSIHYLMDGQVQNDPESLFGFEQSTLMLLDSVIRREAGDSLSGADARSAALRMNAEIHLAHHCHEPDLSPDRLASALNVSRRTLYSALAATGQTPQSLIQEYRLQASRRALEDPADANRNLLELAIACGFTDITHFGRAFKARFGCSPGAYRLARRTGSTA
ncbi:AraC family transcriptional regulator [Burkholderia paludis]|uniref:helix-turn-helix domain-containing protein n=1 Tax=Burkholderia paludis TaxID=1506587 RepID=UPI0004DB7394|nr:helix-turn-helix domain-containing protein [Burkholderia paludis]KFG92620.1 AraC family transcriptional regulator [Burkholderia paludis]